MAKRNNTYEVKEVGKGLVKAERCSCHKVRAAKIATICNFCVTRCKKVPFWKGKKLSIRYLTQACGLQQGSQS